jgi:hypothetical protein
MQTLKQGLEESLRRMLDAQGFLSDVIERSVDSLALPSAVEPWKSFMFKLYSSVAATAAIRALLACSVPGTTDSYETVLTSIVREAEDGKGRGDSHHCYLVGGQVRDVLRGVLSDDFDFAYTCTAREVALVCVSHEWSTKYKCIGPTSRPNYVLVGDESSSNYLEGFSLDFNATAACHKMDFRQNMLFYDLSNDVIVDKTGHGVNDIRTRALRLSCASAPGAGETFVAWAAATITPGFKELRYIKFLLRAQAKGEPLSTDATECQFVVASLKAALRSNADALRSFWFLYALEKQLKTAEGVAALRDWVVAHGGETWWEADWVPLVRATAGSSYEAAGLPARVVRWWPMAWWGRGRGLVRDPVRDVGMDAGKARPLIRPYLWSLGKDAAAAERGSVRV